MSSLASRPDPTPANTARRGVLRGLRGRLLIALAIPVVLAIAGVLGGAASASAAEAQVVPLPTIEVHAQSYRLGSTRLLLVTSILVANIGGVHMEVSCGTCQRLNGPIRETHPTRTSKRFVGVDWLISLGHGILLEVRHAGEMGRYLLLGASAHDSLVYKSHGCLAMSTRTRVSCPSTVVEVTKGGGVVGGNPPAKSGSGLPAGGANKAAEEAAAKKKAEEAEAKRKAEEAAAKKKAEEAAAKKKAEEEAAARKKAEEEAAAAARRRAEEEAANRTWTETVGGVTHTWTNYANAGGNQGQSINTSQSVQVKCRVEGFKVADGDTWWYRIASSPWNQAYYASADAFYNDGATSGSLIGTPFVDTAVQLC